MSQNTSAYTPDHQASCSNMKKRRTPTEHHDSLDGHQSVSSSMACSCSWIRLGSMESRSAGGYYIVGGFCCYRRRNLGSVSVHP